MKIKHILISQPEPQDIEKTPYGDIQRKYGVVFKFFKFISIEGIKGKEFRKDRISVLDFSAVIFTSRQAVDHYFRICKELRAEVPDSMKYFCTTESTALYLQKYIQYRKRKIFFTNPKKDSLAKLIAKHIEEKFLLPCTDINTGGFVDELKKNNVNFKRAVIYRTVPSDFSGIDIERFDMLVLFSPYGIEALKKGVPGFEQGDKIIAAFGPATYKAIEKAGFKVQIKAPTPAAPSMSMALDQFLEKNNKKR